MLGVDGISDFDALHSGSTRPPDGDQRAGPIRTSALSHKAPWPEAYPQIRVELGWARNLMFGRRSNLPCRGEGVNRNQASELVFMAWSDHGGTVDAQHDKGDSDNLNSCSRGRRLRARKCGHWKYVYRHWTADRSGRPGNPKWRVDPTARGGNEQ
jgi:hypothetical protein